MRALGKNLAYLAAAITLSLLASAGPHVAHRKNPPISATTDTESLPAINQLLSSSTTGQTIADLAYARRLALGLVGVIPSLEEIRWYTKLPEADRRARYREKLLADRRFAETLAARLLKAWLPAEPGDNFVLYRKQRVHAWLVEQIDSNRPYDVIVRDLLTATGRWTDTPAVNYITAYKSHPEELAGHATKHFLGLRIDCAQCHDHPFASWKQSQFRGLASHFGLTRISFQGVQDNGKKLYRFDKEDEEDAEGTLVEPAFPFEVAGSFAKSKPLRAQLAYWITNSANPYFASAITNRAWEMMLGQPIVAPVDNLEGKVSLENLLPLLARDFQTHGHDLRRLFRVIAQTDAFARPAQLDHPDTSSAPWSTFPATRLSPEQIAASLVQVSSLRTVDGETGPLRRVTSFFDQQDFVRLFANKGDDVDGTVGQRLMLMNDHLVAERLRADLLTSAGSLALLSPNDATCVEAAFLLCLTRPPEPDEATFFMNWLRDTEGRKRDRVVEDILWTLVNSTEFLWNH